MKKKIAIIGGKGNEGQRWAKIMTDLGHDVAIVDNGDNPDPIKTSDVVIIALKWDLFRGQFTGVNQLISLIPKGSFCISVMGAMTLETILRTDVRQSNESAAIEKLWRSREIDLARIHCMCAHDVPLVGKNVILCEPLDAGNREWVTSILNSQNARIVCTSAEHHDKMVRFTQGMIRNIALAFASAMKSEGVTLSDLLDFATPPFLAFLCCVSRLLVQPVDLNLAISTDHAGATILDHMLSAFGKTGTLSKVSGSVEERRIMISHICSAFCSDKRVKLLAGGAGSFFESMMLELRKDS